MCHRRVVWKGLARCGAEAVSAAGAGAGPLGLGPQALASRALSGQAAPVVSHLGIHPAPHSWVGLKLWKDLAQMLSVISLPQLPWSQGFTSTGYMLASCGARPALLSPPQPMAQFTRSFLHTTLSSSRAVGLLDSTGQTTQGQDAGSPQGAVSLGVPLGPENPRALSRQSFPLSVSVVI